MRIKSSKKRFIISFLLIMVFMLFPLNIITAFAEDAAFEQSISGFPDSYKSYLRDLHTKYPNWSFEALNTGVDWNTAVAAESNGNKSLVPASYSSSLLKSMNLGDYDYTSGTYLQKDSGWVTATPMAVSYFMDPRNFLNETYIFQFELLSYNSATQTRAAVENILSGTFMSQTNGAISYLDASGNTVTTSEYYSDIIIEASTTYNINPCYLASKIRQEIGATKSGSVTGNYSYNNVSYAGVYNYYNIGANDDANGGAIANGLNWARTTSSNSNTNYGRPWTSPRKSIIGGAQYIAENYISRGQNTQYLQKFNVNPNASSSLYTHQYMTNVSGSASAATTTYSSYSNMGILNDTKTFVIPVFNNMPDNTSIGLSLATDSGVAVTNSNVNLRNIASTENSATLVTIPAGTQVAVLGAVRNSTTYYLNQLKYPYWYKVGVTYSGTYYEGYMCEEYVNVTSSLSVSLGSTYSLNYSTASSTTDKPMFMSLDTRVATVDSNGVISPLALGSTKVVAYTTNGHFSEVNVVSSSQTPEQPTTPSTSNTITSGTYTISSGVISGISSGTTAAQMLSGINEGATAQIYSGGNLITGDTAIGTGMTLVNGSAQEVIAVRGDLTGDGKITVTDMLMIKKKLLSISALTSAQTMAADLSGDGSITVTDFVKMKRILLGLG